MKTVNRYDVLKLAGIAAALSFPIIGKAAPAPNIVIVLADDFGFGDAACFDPQYSKIPTPNIDRLARAGMSFTEAHTSAACCTPSRYGLLTGRYNWRSRLQAGVLPEYGAPLIAPDRLTIAGLLKQQGYQTACFGKWHLGMQWPKQGRKVVFDEPIAEGPTTRGFDYYFGVDAPNMSPYTFIENDRVTVQPTERFAGDKELMITHPGPMAPGWRFDRILSTLTEKAVDYIGQRAQAKQPFFLYFALTTPHDPIAPSEQFKGKSGISGVGDLIMETDWALGQVMEALAKNGVAGNTLVIFTSDNGHSPNTKLQPFINAGHRVSGPFRGYKRDAWEGGHHVPFVVSWPGTVKPAGECAQPVSLNDIMATCAQITGAKLPDNAGEDSFSLLPLLKGEKSFGREAVVSHSSKGSFAIQRGQWKLIVEPGSGSGDTAAEPGQLYNLAADIGETKNLYAQNPELVTEMTALLKKYIDDGRSTPGPKQTNDAPVELDEKAGSGQGEPEA